MEYGSAGHWVNPSLPPTQHEAAQLPLPLLHHQPPPPTSALNFPLPHPTSYSHSHSHYSDPNLSSVPSHDYYAYATPATDTNPLEIRLPGVDPCVPIDGCGGPLPPEAYGYTPSAAGAASVPGVVRMAYYSATGGAVGQFGASAFSYGTVGTNVPTHTIGGLDKKMQKVIDGGAAADSVRVCTACNVVCNSEKVFACHLAGGKHTMKAHGRSSNGLGSSVQGPLNLWVNKTKKHPIAVGAMRKPLNRTAKVQSVFCEICKIECNSQEVLNSHKMGKKHKSKLQKLQESFMPKPKVGPTTTSVKDSPVAKEGKASLEEPQKRKAPEVEEDLETKKRKVIERGATADAVRVCTLCNVVCNSETVFKYHIEGQKHANMVKKQEEAAAVC